MKRILCLIFILLGFTIFAQNEELSLKAEERVRELSIIKTAFINLHPGLYRFNTPLKVEMYFEEMRKKLNTPISDREYFILLSKLTATLKCGHTYLNPWNQTNYVSNKYFSKSFMPFLYKVSNDKFIITHNLSNHKAISVGDEIISINSVKVSTIIDSLLIVSRTDGNNGLSRKITNLNITPIDIDTSNYSFFDIYFPLYFQNNFNAVAYDFVIKKYNGKKINVKLKSVTKKERLWRFTSTYGMVPLHEKNWEFTFLNSSTAYLRLGDFETWEWKADYRKYLDSVFSIIRMSSSKNLIIDIRGNEGGDDEARDEVLSYVIQKPFGCDNPIKKRYKFLSIPDTLIPYLKTWNKESKKPKNEIDYAKTGDGYYEHIETSKTPCKLIFPKENLFKGNVFLLTNSSNSSTTFTMTDIFQQTKSGTIIGEVTGGTKQGLNGGQFLFLYLPFSKLEIDIPIIWGAPAKTRPDEGVKPDYIINITQKDIYYGIDAQLQFALSKIKK